jgi:hypothetical protein
MKEIYLFFEDDICDAMHKSKGSKFFAMEEEDFVFLSDYQITHLSELVKILK